MPKKPIAIRNICYLVIFSLNIIDPKIKVKIGWVLFMIIASLTLTILNPNVKHINAIAPKHPLYQKQILKILGLLG